MNYPTYDQIMMSNTRLEYNEYILDLIRYERNRLVKEYLNKEKLDIYFNEICNEKLSHAKRKYLLCELCEFLISPVNMVHYSTLFLAMLGSDEPLKELNNNPTIFTDDINTVLLRFKKTDSYEYSNSSAPIGHES
ncbi:MAG TPA: hypothetical protein VIM65_15225 [Cyclobacteriaceae bacterium]